MTAEELVRAVRLDFIQDERSDRFWRKVHPSHRAEYAAVGRRACTRRRELLKSETFRRVAQGCVAAGDHDTLGLVALVTWLAAIHSLPDWEPDPQAWVARLREQEQLRAQYARQLREIASALRPEYAEQLKTVADEIESDDLAILTLPGGSSLAHCAHDVFAHFTVDIENLGTRGSASNSGGAWRGWLVRELRAKLPHFAHTPNPYATMAELLTWAGIGSITPMLVRSILARGRT